jgi:hypothetical protein
MAKVTGQVLARCPGGRQLEHAAAHGATDAEELVLGGEGAGHRLSVDGPVHDRARGREAQRACLHALAHELRHALDVLGRCGLIARAALAHGVGANRAVRHLRSHVEPQRAAVERVEKLRKALPLPLDALGQRGAGNVLDALHQLDQELLLAGRHRREADAAVAEHRGGHAVGSRREKMWIPGDLAVVVRVDIDEAGCHQQAVGIDLASRRPIDPAHGHDASVLHRDVTAVAGLARAVVEGSAANDQVVHALVSREDPPSEDNADGARPEGREAVSDCRDRTSSDRCACRLDDSLRS